MERPNPNGSKKPFSTFYGQLSSAKLAEYASWTERREMDLPQLNADLNEIFERVCEGDTGYMDRLRDSCGGPEGLITLYRTAGRDAGTFQMLLTLCDDCFDSDIDELAAVARAAGGGAKLLELVKTKGENHLRNLRSNMPAEQMEKVGFEQLLDDDVVDGYQQSLIEAFMAAPTEAALRVLKRLRLMLGGEVLHIEPGKGKQFIAHLSVVGPFEGPCTVVAMWSEAEGPMVKVTTATLTTPGGSLVLRGELLPEFACGYAIWAAWTEFLSDSKGDVSRRKARIEAVTFDDLTKIKVGVGGSPEAYQTAGDLADSAALKSKGLCCFSFSSKLVGDLAGIWVLHAHCAEIAVDELTGQCLGFEIRAVSLKLAKLDREVESPSTMKVTPADVKGDAKARGMKAEALELFIKQRGLILELAHSCSSHQVLKAWNLCKLELMDGASHATHYDRHNVADPILDLDGWLKTMTTDRIAYLFFSLKGLAGHLKVLRDEISRFIASALAARAQGNYELFSEHEQAAHKLMSALVKAAKLSSGNEAVREKEWELFAFDIDLDLGPFGRFLLRRDEGGGVDTGSLPPIEKVPGPTLDRMMRFIEGSLFRSKEGFADALLLLQQDIKAVTDVLEQAEAQGFGDGEVALTIASALDGIWDWIAKLAASATFDFKPVRIVFGTRAVLTLSRVDGQVAHDVKLKPRK